MLNFFPFLVQGLLMTVDEFFCHRTRPLRRWERVGHPLDTLSFIICLAFLLFTVPSSGTRSVFMILSIISCVFITKDEWQHRELCSGFENWLHAMLFILHPVLLIWAGVLWWWQDPSFVVVVGSEVVLATGIMFYQFFFWNVWRRDRQ